MVFGEDGRVHDGTVELKFSGPLMSTACGAAARRPIRTEAEAELLMQDDRRVCPQCFREVE